MVNVKDVILKCKEIPLFERYLILMSINNGDFFVSDDIYNDSLKSFTITDGQDFVMEIGYNEEDFNPYLIECTGLEGLIRLVDLNKIKFNIVNPSGI